MFRTIRLTAAALAVAIASLALAGTASAHNRGAAYEFRGAAVVAPGTGAVQLQVQVDGGNRPALKALLGAAQPTTFKADGHTRWISVNGNAPVVGASDTILAGDLVRVVIRAPFHTPLATLLSYPAASITDLSARTRPAGRLFLFGAIASAIDTTNHTITVDVNFGNWRGLFALLGQPVHQTFTYDANTTVFLKWRHGVPIGVDPGLIHAGVPLTLRVFGPTWNTPLATLLATPLWRVKIGEPMRFALRDGAELPGT
jgi:hypothetical protein